MFVEVFIQLLRNFVIFFKRCLTKFCLRIATNAALTYCDRLLFPILKPVLRDGRSSRTPFLMTSFILDPRPVRVHAGERRSRVDPC